MPDEDVQLTLIYVCIYEQSLLLLLYSIGISRHVRSRSVVLTQ